MISWVMFVILIVHIFCYIFVGDKHGLCKVIIWSEWVFQIECFQIECFRIQCTILSQTTALNQQ
jgi:hypothetical protein